VAAMATSATTSGEWLTTALRELRERKEGALHLDTDLIFGLVSFCELAPPLDAADYLAVRALLLNLETMRTVCVSSVSTI
jgi:hypothetical protein